MELEQKTQLPVISFNVEELEAWAISLTEKYTNLVVTEETVSDIKKDMAGINKQKDKIDVARKETVKQISEPIKVFEIQIKRICGIFDTAYTHLSKQVKVFEDNERQLKKESVQKVIAEAIAESGLVDFDIQILDKWLNKTTTIKSIKADIDSLVNAKIQEEATRKLVEQARSDRLSYIEQLVNSYKTTLGLVLPVTRFLTDKFTDPNKSLDRISMMIKEVFYTEKEELEKEQELLAQQEIQAETKQKSEIIPVLQEITPVAETPLLTSTSKRTTPVDDIILIKVRTVQLSYDNKNTEEIKELFGKIQKLCTSFLVTK